MKKKNVQNSPFAVAKQWFLTYGSMRTKILCGNLGPRAYMYIYICIFICIYIYCETYAYSHMPARVHHLLISLQPGVGSMPAWRWVGLRLSNSRYQWRFAEDGVDRYAVRCKLWSAWFQRGNESVVQPGRAGEVGGGQLPLSVWQYIHIYIYMYIYI